MRFVIGFGEGVVYGDKIEVYGEEGQLLFWVNLMQGYISWFIVKYNEVLLVLGFYYEFCGG